MRWPWGAGTTELSMNMLHTDERGTFGSQMVKCYSARTFELGGDSFSDLARHTEPQRATQERKLLSELTSHVEDVWRQGYKLVERNRATSDGWKRLTFILSGGGLRLPVLDRHIRTRRPQTLVFRTADTSFTVSWHRPQEVQHFPPRNPTPTAEIEQSFLAVAHGLSFVRELWPDQLVPGSTTPVPSSQVPYHDPGLRYGEGDN